MRLWPDVIQESLANAKVSIIIIIRHAPYQCVAPLATNSLHSDLSKASSIASSKVRLCRGKRATVIGIGCNSLNRPPLRIAQQYQRNLDLYIVEKYFQCATIPSRTMWVYLHSFSRCCLPKIPTSTKFRENLNLQQFKVIQGRWFFVPIKSAHATSY